MFSLFSSFAFIFKGCFAAMIDIICCWCSFRFDYYYYFIFALMLIAMPIMMPLLTLSLISICWYDCFCCHTLYINTQAPFIFCFSLSFWLRFLDIFISLSLSFFSYFVLFTLMMLSLISLYFSLISLMLLIHHFRLFFAVYYIFIDMLMLIWCWCFDIILLIDDAFADDIWLRRFSPFSPWCLPMPCHYWCRHDFRWRFIFLPLFITLPLLALTRWFLTLDDFYMILIFSMPFYFLLIFLICWLRLPLFSLSSAYFFAFAAAPFSLCRCFCCHWLLSIVAAAVFAFAISPCWCCAFAAIYTFAIISICFRCCWLFYLFSMLPLFRHADFHTWFRLLDFSFISDADAFAMLSLSPWLRHAIAVCWFSFCFSFHASFRCFFYAMPWLFAAYLRKDMPWDAPWCLMRLRFFACFFALRECCCFHYFRSICFRCFSSRLMRFAFSSLRW